MSAEYKWNGYDWIWDDGGGESVQDTGSGHKGNDDNDEYDAGYLRNLPGDGTK